MRTFLVVGALLAGVPVRAALIRGGGVVPNIAHIAKLPGTQRAAESIPGGPETLRILAVQGLPNPNKFMDYLLQHAPPGYELQWPLEGSAEKKTNFLIQQLPTLVAAAREAAVDPSLHQILRKKSQYVQRYIGSSHPQYVHYVRALQAEAAAFAAFAPEDPHLQEMLEDANELLWESDQKWLESRIDGFLEFLGRPLPEREALIPHPADMEHAGLWKMARRGRAGIDEEAHGHLQALVSRMAAIVPTNDEAVFRVRSIDTLVTRLMVLNPGPELQALSLETGRRAEEADRAWAAARSETFSVSRAERAAERDSHQRSETRLQKSPDLSSIMTRAYGAMTLAQQPKIFGIGHDIEPRFLAAVLDSPSILTSFDGFLKDTFAFRRSEVKELRLLASEARILETSHVEFRFQLRADLYLGFNGPARAHGDTRISRGSGEPPNGSMMNIRVFVKGRKIKSVSFEKIPSSIPPPSGE